MLCFLGLSNLVCAQNDWKLYPNKSTSNAYSGSQSGSIDYVVDARINKLSDNFAEENKSKKSLAGYRVQIFFGDRNQANSVKTEFLKEHSGTDTYLTYLAPNFRVRVGNFRTKLNADAFLHQIKKDYPTAYVVKDEIELPKL